MNDLIAFLRARLDEDALWATEASRSDDVVVQSGAHWQWEDRSTDVTVEPDPGRDVYVGGTDTEVSLRSKEVRPTSVGDLPQFAISSADEVPSAVGGHIIRHDPARVLREVEAKRRIVDRYTWLREHGDTGDAAWVLPLLAAAYREHSDYRQEWTP